MEYRYRVGETVESVRVERDGDDYRASVGERTYAVSVRRSASGDLTLIVDGQRHTAHVASNGTKRFVAVDGQALELALPETGRARRRQPGEDSLAASMPGQVRQVLVAAGDDVERGQTLLVLEAMKMEIRVAAPHAGRVAKVWVGAGQVVDRGQTLVELANTAGEHR